VRDAAVVGVPHPERGEEVVACVVLAHTLPGGSLPETVREVLRAWCAQQLAPYKLPRQFVVLDVFPLDSSGKVIKSALKAALAKVAGGAFTKA
jgi:acyl-coenzyme A synthetase/AMP-(fatty) acid ligase